MTRPHLPAVMRVGTPLARTGAVCVAVFALALLGLALKNQIKVALSSGDTVTAVFAENYGLTPGLSKVKVAGLQVGLVTGVEPAEDGTAVVEMKVDEEALATLGSTPSARVVPLTILGGQYSVELHRGGNGAYDGAAIPRERTSTPVELDRILEALPADTRRSTRGVVSGARRTLAEGGRDGVHDVVRTAPEVLPPAGVLLRSLQGENPGNDLPSIVTDLQAFGETLNHRDERLDEILRDLGTTTTVLAAHDRDLDATLEQLPATLAATDRGMARLDGTLDQLGETTTRLRPAIREAGPLLDVLGPTLREARPVVVQLPPLLRDARVAVEQLVPTSVLATRVVDDLRGPVIQRVEGPILDKLGSTWRGTGEYSRSGGGIQADNKFYEEIGYMIANLDRASMTQDAQGSLLNFQAGVGTSTVVPLALDEALAQLVPASNGAR